MAQPLLDKVKEGVVSALSPGSAEASRAVHWMNDFKNDTQNVENNCAVALQLIQEPDTSQYSAQFKLFALNSLENLIRIGWYSISGEFKEHVKRTLESLISEPSLSVNFLSDGLSRCIVEVIMREWPQKWPQLMSLLVSAEKKSSVLHVMWRLAEDVGVQFKPKNPQRRREIMTTITENLNTILGYIWDCLQSDQSILCLLSLKTLTAYLEWTPIDGQLLRFLCHILAADCPAENTFVLQSKTIACDCLTTILMRKKLKCSEIEALDILFKEDILSILIRLLQQCRSSCDEPSFNPTFLELSKKVCLLMTSAGKFLLSLENPAIHIHVVHILIFEMLLVFKHQNQGICYSSADFFKAAWEHAILSGHVSGCIHDSCISNFLYPSFVLKELIKSHERLKMDEQKFHALMQQLFAAIPRQLTKCKPEHVFVVHEFDSYAEYEQFYIRFKEDLANLLRLMTSIDPQFATNCLLHFVNQVSETNQTSEAASLASWESAALVMDCVCNKLPCTKEFADQVVPFTSHLLSAPSQLPNLLSIQLSCVSATTAFFHHFHPFIRKQLIDRIFYLAKFPLNINSTSSDQQSAKSLKRHACACFVKICRRFPHLLLPLFDELQQELTSGNFSRMELAALIEGLILISNVSDDPMRLKVLISRVLSHIEWLKGFDMDTRSFMMFVGVAGTGDPLSEVAVSNRGLIQQAVTLLLALFRRVETKSVLIPEVLPFLKALVAIACNLNEMWDPSFRSVCNPSLSEKIYSSASDLDKLHLLEYVVSSRDARNTQAIDRKIQNFLWSMHESIFTVFGCAFSSLRPDIYSESAFFLNTLGKCYFLPRMKLKLIVKHFLKPFVQNSALEQESLQRTIDPLFSSFMPWLFKHIDERWDVFRSQESHPPDDERLEEEIINDQSNRLLSREFADLFSCLLLKSAKGSTPLEVEEPNSPLMDVDSSYTPALESEVSLSEIGRYLIANRLVSLVSMAAGTLTWPDSLVNHKAILMNRLLLKELLENRLISTVDDVSFFVSHIFLAFRLLEEDEQNQSSLLQLTLVVYEELTKNYREDMRAPFWLLSQSQESEWAKFHQTLIQPSLSGKAIVSDKRKKDAVRALLSNLCRNDSQPCQKVLIKNLGSFVLSKKKRENKDAIDNGDEAASFIHLLS